MQNSIIWALSILGVAAGVLISWLVKDETQWYRKWFRLAAVFFILASGLVARPWGITPAIIIIIALWWRIELAVLGWICMSFIGGIMSAQLLMISGIPLAGYYYSSGERRSFLWFLTVPIAVFIPYVF